MGNVVFYTLLWILIITLIVATYLREKNRKAERFERLKESFGIRDTETFDDGKFDKAPLLFEHQKETVPGDFYLDDITVNDLALKEVYSRLNRCVTCAGSDMLYCMLRTLPALPDGAESNYRNIKGFIEDRDRSVRLLRILDRLGNDGSVDGFGILKDLEGAKQKSILYDIIPLAVLICAVISTAFYPLFGMIATIVMICLCIYLYFNGKSRMDEHLRGLALALRMIRCASALDPECEGFDRYKGLYRLTGGDFLISYKVQTTSNPLSLIFDYVRMISHIDLIAYKLKISAVSSHIDELLALYSDIGTLDARLAIASYIARRPHCMSSVCDGAGISAKEIYHPLVTDPVCNDIETKRGIVLTGSNASGKSTFLKAVGLNVIFAKNLGFAFASEFVTGIDKLYTSMAISDDLLKKESYYVVEAKSIKRICDEAGDGRILCIIDEVLRGTNTIERIAASTEILRYLCKPNVLCFAATHDLELTKLLGDDMDCYYFTEEMVGDEVVFPFNIRKGSTDKTNAIRLLSMLGYDDQIINKANSLVDNYRKTGKWESGR